MTPNAELAYQVLDHIDAHPEQWNQGLYIGRRECGTVACFAGWTVLLATHAVPAYSDDTCSQTGIVRVNDRALDVSDYAAELLGIGFVDGDYLFSPSNNRTDLGQLVDELFGPRPAVTR